MDSDRPKDAVLYCEKLLGLRSDCNIPYCHQSESSTGWLLYNADVDGWFIGFRCPEHGRSGAWGPEWQPLIEEVIEEKAKEGFDVTAALEALRDEHKRKRVL